MKRILLLVFCCIAAATTFAQSDGDYYVYIFKTQAKYYMNWDAAKGCYTVTVPQLDGDFKIYSKDYVQGNNNQDHLIFGSANGFNGVYVGYDKTLANPGNNLCIEGGGILYNAVMEFYPGQPTTLKVTEGTKQPPLPTEPLITVKITASEGIAPTIGTVTCDIGTTNISSPETLTYGIYALYDSSKQRNKVINVTTTKLTGNTLTLTDLLPGSINEVKLYAVTLYDNQTLYNDTEGTIKTPAIPILIGQLTDGVWKPNVGLKYHSVSDDGKVYTFYPRLTDNGEFSFVSKLGANDTDWNTVNSGDRYAPSQNRVTAPDSEWIPYTTYSESTENAWIPENFSPEYLYQVDFDFISHEIKVTGIALTGIDAITGDTLPAKVDVYTITGLLLRRAVDRDSALDGLPAGFYISGGRKFVVD